jgi:hypothetical protein
MATIFISYRREDSSEVTGRLRDRLAQSFGDKAVFIDVDNVPLGVNFVEFLDRKVAECELLLAVIGRDWLTAEDEDGNKRLDNADDFVRIEIESALNRKIPVIPICVRGARMPRQDQLPRTLQELALRNGLPIRADPDFNRDVSRLINGLEEHLSIVAKAEKTGKKEHNNQEKAEISKKNVLSIYLAKPGRLVKEVIDRIPSLQRKTVLVGATIGIIFGLLMVITLGSPGFAKEADLVWYFIIVCGIICGFTGINVFAIGSSAVTFIGMFTWLIIWLMRRTV